MAGLAPLRRTSTLWITDGDKTGTGRAKHPDRILRVQKRLQQLKRLRSATVGLSVCMQDQVGLVAGTHRENIEARQGDENRTEGQPEKESRHPQQQRQCHP